MEGGFFGFFCCLFCRVCVEAEVGGGQSGAVRRGGEAEGIAVAGIGVEIPKLLLGKKSHHDMVHDDLISPSSSSTLAMRRS